MINTGDLYVMYIPYLSSFTRSTKKEYCLYEHSHGIIVDIDRTPEDTHNINHSQILDYSKIKDNEIVVQVLDNRGLLRYELCHDISDIIDYLENEFSNFKVLLYTNHSVKHDFPHLIKNVRKYEILR